MSKRRNVVGAALASTLALGALTLGQGFAHADPAPQADDVVGVGSDIIQNSVNFLADGFTDGTLGYNQAGNQHRIFNYDAGSDANGRNSFTDPKLSAAGTALKDVPALDPSVQLLAGTSPVNRPNGGGNGLKALYKDTLHLIDYARTPNLPVAGQAASGVGTLHTIQFAEDQQYIATATETNAPATLTNADLYNIYAGTYTKWSDVPGYSGAAGSQAIVPLIPQDGAGVLTIFLAEINKAKGSGPALTISSVGPNVRQVQQNDPTTITGLNTTDKPNAIVPFPKGRYELLGTGYFKNPHPLYDPASSFSDANTLDNEGIKLHIPSTDGVGASGFKAAINYYITFRQSDANATGGWQPGSTLNWVKTLFYNQAWVSDPDHTPPPFFASPAAETILKKIGLTPHYEDKGTV